MTFALVTEGISEYTIIKHLLVKYFKDGEEPEINQMCPLLSDNEKKQADYGGWVEVLNYCEQEEELKNVLIENDYLVIQIDTDVCETAPYCVDRGTKVDEELHNAVVERLLQNMPQSIKDRYIDKIIFAICINTTECWLLAPYYSDDTHRCKTTNCLSHLNTAIERKNIDKISEKSKNSSKSRKSYQQILSNFKRKKEIENYSVHNYGFTKFVEQLAKI